MASVYRCSNSFDKKTLNKKFVYKTGLGKLRVQNELKDERDSSHGDNDGQFALDKLGCSYTETIGDEDRHRGQSVIVRTGQGRKYATLTCVK